MADRGNATRRNLHAWAFREALPDGITKRNIRISRALGSIAPGEEAAVQMRDALAVLVGAGSFATDSGRLLDAPQRPAQPSQN